MQSSPWFSHMVAGFLGAPSAPPSGCSSLSAALRTLWELHDVDIRLQGQKSHSTSGISATSLHYGWNVDLHSSCSADDERSAAVGVLCKALVVTSQACSLHAVPEDLVEAVHRAQFVWDALHDWDRQHLSSWLSWQQINAMPLSQVALRPALLPALVHSKAYILDLLRSCANVCEHTHQKATAAATAAAAAASARAKASPQDSAAFDAFINASPAMLASAGGSASGTSTSRRGTSTGRERSRSRSAPAPADRSLGNHHRQPSQEELLFFHATQEMHHATDDEGGGDRGSAGGAGAGAGGAGAAAASRARAARSPMSPRSASKQSEYHTPPPGSLNLYTSDERRGLPGDTFVSSGTYTALHASSAVLRAAADAVLQAAYAAEADQLLAQTQPRIAFAVIRPPGHHCGARSRLGEESLGFCLLNNALQVARYAQYQHGVRTALARVQRADFSKLPTPSELKPLRVAIVDIDVHCGNGTEEVLRAIGAAQLPGLEEHVLWYKREQLLKPAASVHPDCDYTVDYSKEKDPAGSVVVDKQHKLMYLPPQPSGSHSAPPPPAPTAVPMVDPSKAYAHLLEAMGSLPPTIAAAPVMPQQLLYASIHQYNNTLFPAEMDVDGVECGRTTARIFVPAHATPATTMVATSGCEPEERFSSHLFNPLGLLDAAKGTSGRGTGSADTAPADLAAIPEHYLAALSLAVPVHTDRERKSSNPGGKEWRKLFADSLLPAVRAFSPDLIVVSAGFDAHAADPVGMLNLQDEDYTWCAQQLLGLQPSVGIIAVLEGGYAASTASAGPPGNLGTAAAAFVAGLCSAPLAPSSTSTTAASGGTCASCSTVATTPAAVADSARLRAAAEAAVCSTVLCHAVANAPVPSTAAAVSSTAAHNLSAISNDSRGSNASARTLPLPSRNTGRRSGSSSASPASASSAGDMTIAQALAQHNSTVAAVSDEDVEGDISLAELYGTRSPPHSGSGSGWGSGSGSGSGDRGGQQQHKQKQRQPEKIRHRSGVAVQRGKLPLTTAATDGSAEAERYAADTESDHDDWRQLCSDGEEEEQKEEEEDERGRPRSRSRSASTKANAAEPLDAHDSSMPAWKRRKLTGEAHPFYKPTVHYGTGGALERKLAQRSVTDALLTTGRMPSYSTDHDEHTTGEEIRDSDNEDDEDDEDEDDNDDHGSDSDSVIHRGSDRGRGGAGRGSRGRAGGRAGGSATGRGGGRGGARGGGTTGGGGASSRRGAANITHPSRKTTSAAVADGLLEDSIED